MDSYTRIYVSNLPKDVYSRDLREVFREFGPIRYVDVKRTPNVFGCYYAFIEFHVRKDAEAAVSANGRIKFEGKELLVEHAVRANQRVRSRVRRSTFQLRVSGLPLSGSWQDLKSHMSSAGEVCFADVEKYRGTGIVEFYRYEDMKYALKKLDGSKLFSHEDEVGYIRLKETRSRMSPRSRSRSRSSSRTRRSRRRSYSRLRRSRSHSKRRSRSNSRSRSRWDSWSQSSSDSSSQSGSDSSSGSCSDSPSGSSSDSSSGSCSDSSNGTYSDSSSRSSSDSRGRRSRYHSGVRRSRSYSRGRRSRSHSGVRRSRSYSRDRSYSGLRRRRTYSRSRSRSWGRRSHYPTRVRSSPRHRTRSSPSPRRSPDSNKKDK